MQQSSLCESVSGPIIHSKPQKKKNLKNIQCLFKYSPFVPASLLLFISQLDA